MLKVSQFIHKRLFNKYNKKLRRVLGHLDDASFLQLAWAVDLLQSNFTTDVRRYLQYPKEAHTTSVKSGYVIHKWEIETLVLLLLTTPKIPKFGDIAKQPGSQQFSTLVEIVNLLRKLENSESAITLSDDNILMELHRIGQRQFGWQRGFATKERIYRFAYVYGQGECAGFFSRTFGLNISDFLFVCFFLHAVFRQLPWIEKPDLRQFGIEATQVDVALSLLSQPLADLRSEVQALVHDASKNSMSRVAYLPSALRQYPVVNFTEFEKYISPLPELIMFRATNGLYYDLRKGP